MWGVASSTFFSSSKAVPFRRKASMLYGSSVLAYIHNTNIVIRRASMLYDSSMLTYIHNTNIVMRKTSML